MQVSVNLHTLKTLYESVIGEWDDDLPFDTALHRISRYSINCRSQRDYWHREWTKANAAIQVLAEQIEELRAEEEPDHRELRDWQYAQELIAEKYEAWISPDDAPPLLMLGDLLNLIEDKEGTIRQLNYLIDEAWDQVDLKWEPASGPRDKLTNIKSELQRLRRNLDQLREDFRRTPPRYSVPNIWDALFGYAETPYLYQEGAEQGSGRYDYDAMTERIIDTIHAMRGRTTVQGNEAWLHLRDLAESVDKQFVRETQDPRQWKELIAQRLEQNDADRSDAVTLRQRIAAELFSDPYDVDAVIATLKEYQTAFIAYDDIQEVLSKYDINQANEYDTPAEALEVRLARLTDLEHEVRAHAPHIRAAIDNMADLL